MTNPNCECCVGTGKIFCGQAGGGDWEDCFCNVEPKKTHLQQMEELWRGIAELHFDAQMKAKDLKEIREQQSLCDKARFIARTLKAYRTELEG